MKEPIEKLSNFEISNKRISMLQGPHFIFNSMIFGSFTFMALAFFKP